MNPKEPPLEDLSFLEVPLFHGSRDIAGVLKNGVRRDPAIQLYHSPEYAWSGMRGGAFTSGGGINWKGYVWASWKELPKAARAEFQRRIGRHITKADELGEEVSLFWASYRKAEAQDYMAWEQQNEPPLAFDPRRLPGVLWAFRPDVSSKAEVVLVLRAGPPVSIRQALIHDWKNAPDRGTVP